MLKPRKRISKKQLKEDKFITTVYNVQSYLEENWQKLAMGAVAAIAVIAVGYFIVTSGTERENQAAGALYQLEIRYMSGMYDSTLVMGLENYLGTYEDTNSGANAVFYLANTHYQMGNFVKAEESFQAFLDKGDGPDFLKLSAMNGIASCYEQRNLLNEASNYYKQAIDRYQNEFLVSNSYIGAARVLHKLGQNDEAKRFCETVLEKYPDSSQEVEARIILAQM